MGHRITQTIYTCDVCGKTPEDGKYLWHMGNQVWCEECCDEQENNPDIETPRFGGVYIGVNNKQN